MKRKLVLLILALAALFALSACGSGSELHGRWGTEGNYISFRRGGSGYGYNAQIRDSYGQGRFPFTWEASEGTLIIRSPNMRGGTSTRTNTYQIVGQSLILGRGIVLVNPENSSSAVYSTTLQRLR